MESCMYCGLDFPDDEMREHAYGMACEDCHANCDHDVVECGQCQDCFEHLDLF